MRLTLLYLAILVLLSGCGPTPSPILAPELNHYTEPQQQCRHILDVNNPFGKEVEKACQQFLKRLDMANETADKLAGESLKKGERKQLEISYARDRNRLKLQYEELLEHIKKATLESIRLDDVDVFIEGVSFAGNPFIEPYYDYMKRKTPRFDKDARYLGFQRQESERLMLKAQQYLQQGKREKALSLFEKAADLNNAQAARSTALLYEERNTQQAIAWHLKAVQGGVMDSCLYLGRLYQQEGDQKRALEWYRKSADTNNAQAQYQLYLLEKEKPNALSWLQKSAANGYAEAQYRYAIILMGESKTGQAIELLQQASQSGYTQASDYLGNYFYKLKLYESALKQLSQSESADAFYLRAKMTEVGTGTPKNYDEAYTLYTRAAALGAKNVDKDLQRVSMLLSKEQKEKAAKEQREQKKRMAAMVKQCGAIPTPAAVKKSGKKFHIIGRASVPVGNRSFVIYGDDGEDYYLLRARGIREGDRVDISVMSTGSTAALSSASDDEEVKIYQFTFLKECIIEEQEQ